MAGYIGSKAVNLSTTGADIAGDADVSGALDVGGAFTSQGIDDNATSTAMTLDGSGNLLVGKNALSGSTAGTEIFSVGLGRFVRSGGDVLNLNRLSTDGTIVDIHKDGASVGRIGVASSAIHLGNQDTGIRFAGGADAIQPWNTGTNAARDAAIDLGLSTSRFKDLYLSGGVYLGGTGSANLISDYETGTWTPTLLGSSTTGSYVYNFQNGSYTKIGRTVHFVCSVSISSVTTAAAGTWRISGLPFSADTGAENGNRFSISLYGVNFDSVNYHWIQGYMGSASYIQFIGTRDNLPWASQSNTNFVVGVSDIITVNGTYTATA